MNILILSSSFPTHENDVLSAKFIKDQIENFKSFDDNVVFHVLVILTFINVLYSLLVLFIR